MQASKEKARALSAALSFLLTKVMIFSFTSSPSHLSDSFFIIQSIAVDEFEMRVPSVRIERRDHPRGDMRRGGDPRK